MNLRSALFVLIIACGIGGWYWHHQRAQQPSRTTSERVVINTIHGSTTITEPVLVELMQSPAMQRLKKINQHGVVPFVRPEAEYNRYDHSVGVMYILRKHGADLTEQVAGLLHDVSHTVFSHVGDHIFKHFSADESYQDNKHAWFLRTYGIEPILQRHGFSVESVLHKEGDFKRLEQHLPDMCADRIEYVIYTGLMYDLITRDDVAFMHQHLHFADGLWFFDDAKAARMYADISVDRTEQLWGAAWNAALYRWAGKAIRQAMKIGLATFEDVHYALTDAEFWEKLVTAEDPSIKENVQKMTHLDDYMQLSDANHYHHNMIVKFRGVDPLVKVDGELKRLTNIDETYKTSYNRVKNHCHEGWFVYYPHSTKQTSKQLNFAV